MSLVEKESLISRAVEKLGLLRDLKHYENMDKNLNDFKISFNATKHVCNTINCNKLYNMYKDWLLLIIANDKRAFTDVFKDKIDTLLKSSKLQTSSSYDDFNGRFKESFGFTDKSTLDIDSLIFLAEQMLKVILYDMIK
jgi:hypothetical protein